ncbi:MAG: chromosomal replication initiator protein DnaA [Patescibacteria group bacterium]
MNNAELWQSTLAQIQLSISQANFATWFKNTKIIDKKEGLISIGVSNSFAKEWIETKYGKDILKILHELDPQIKEINYKVGENNRKTIKKNNFNVSEVGQLDLQEFKLKKDTNINPRYTFDNFVIGPFNELAQAAAWAVAKSPGEVYNPLFIYGKVGLGKTHLLQAIGNDIISNFEKKKVKYIPAERFTSGLVSAISKRTIAEFKEKYKEIDVLILDDVQFLAGKEKTQEEFFHIFNYLYEANKQIILSSDRPPKAIASLAERLRSRFEGGMIADISYPDYETRMAILQNKCVEKKIDFSNDVMEYVATNIQRNIRELEGALLRLSAYQKLNNQNPDVELVRSLLKSLIISPKKMITPQKIISIVADFYDLKEKEILSSSRKREIVKPRQVAMYLLREELKSSYPFIGRKLGGKDHTTAIHACGKITKEVEKNENLAEEINLIKQRVFSA